MEKSKKGLKMDGGWGVWIFLGSLANWLGFNDSGDVFSCWETKKDHFFNIFLMKVLSYSPQKRQEAVALLVTLYFDNGTNYQPLILPSITFGYRYIYMHCV